MLYRSVQQLYLIPANIKNASPTTKPIPNATKLHAESVIPIITAVIKSPHPIKKTPTPDNVQNAFLSSSNTLS